MSWERKRRPQRRDFVALNRRAVPASPWPVRGRYPARAFSPGPAEPANAWPSRQLANLLAPLFDCAAASGAVEVSAAGQFSSWGWRYELTRFRLRGPEAGRRPMRLGLFAGLHGDEPAGCVALVEWLVALAAMPERAAGYELFVYPVCNPTGYEDGTRCNRAGRDLNREFWHRSAEPEVRFIEREIEERRFDGILALHSDDTSDGIYGYAHGRLLNEALLIPALEAAEKVLPRDRRAMIDGFPARDGVLSQCFKGVLAPPAEWERHPFDLIFETPAHAPLCAQVDATCAALDAILESYVRFMAYAQDI